MNAPAPLEHHAQVEAFGRRHRTGLVTLLFTDIVGSTQLKQALGDHEGVARIQQHHALVRALLAQSAEAQEVSVAGDSFFLIFARPSDAVRFALELQQRLGELAKDCRHPLRDRVGIHLGEVVIEQDQKRGLDFYGAQVDTAARVMSLAEAGQVLLTRTAFDSARAALRGEALAGLGEVRWLNHGPYLLKGIEEPIEICEVRVGGAEPVTPPPSTEKAQRYAAPGEEPVLGWRPAVGQAVPGTQWLLEAKLGEGGFGEVWLGRHGRLKEQRVFKFCFRADRVRALKREMTLFRVLKERVGEHPHIVRLLEVNLERPPFYLEEEYVAGRDLRRWWEAQGGIPHVPPEVRLEIVAQAAEGLAAAHAAGIIHRDIKPGNILIGGEWQVTSDEKKGEPREVTSPRSSLVTHHSSLSVKLTDFGIGQVVSQEYLAGVTATGFTGTLVASTSSSHTGTHAYMAPEVVMGRPGSIPSDIYSLGVVLYQLAVGDFARPVTTDWARDISDPLLKEDLQRCFAGQPEERFGNAAELANNLRSMSERRRARAVATKEAFERGAARVASLAVLPFMNMSADPENEFLSDGIAEDLMLALSRVPGLRVPARTSAFAFKGKTQDIRVIGQMLNVETVLEGSVRKARNRLRVTAQLINVADGFHLWSERYDREMQDVFAVQDEITQAIMEALKVRLAGVPLPSPVRRYTENTEAYQLYLKGRFCVAKMTQEGLGMGLRLLEQASNLDPDYPLPCVTQALTFFGLSHFGYLPPKEGMPKGLAAVLRALQLDDSLAEAHTQLGLFRFWYDWDWPAAEQEFQRALQLDPNDSEAHHWYGTFLWAMGQNEEALAHAQKAVAMDPLSPLATMDLGFPLISLGRYDEAIEHAGRMISLDPNFWGAYRVRGLAKAASGQHEEAIVDMEKGVALGGGPFMLCVLGSTLGKLGRTTEAGRVLDELNRLGQQRYVPAFCWITVYLGLGDREQVLAWWGRAIKERDAMLAGFRAIARTWFPDNPDLPALLRHIGL